jgi:hypothetical protein
MYCKEICSHITGECVTLMLMVQTVNSCKVTKDQTASSQITAGTPFVFMKKIEHFRRSGREAEIPKSQVLMHEVLCVFAE